MAEAGTRATSDDGPEGWKTWRTEPEIDSVRQAYLAERRATAPNIENGIYPFRDEHGGIRLSRADVEWLLATHESGGVRGPVDLSDVAHEQRDGLDLRGADLSRVDLRRLPLTRLRGGLNARERLNPRLYETRENAAVHLDGAELSGAHLEEASLSLARFERAILRGATFSAADLFHAHFEGATLSDARFDGADLSWAFFDDSDTYLRGVILTAADTGPARLAGAHWGPADLSIVDWSQLRELGDERLARKSHQLEDYQAAVRANRKLAAVLRDQGLNEDADRFAYRAQLLQRVVLRRQRHWLRYFGSLFLGAVAGYGYRPLRSFATYALVILTFAAIYFFLGGAAGHLLSWNEALVVSMTAFHGRGFFSVVFQPGDPQAAVAAVEAFIGLLIEIILIATFTQRFFAR